MNFDGLGILFHRRLGKVRMSPKETQGLIMQPHYKTTVTKSRNCTRCGWEFGAVVERLLPDGQWIQTQTSHEKCKPCRDLTLAEQSFKTALSYYAKASTIFRSRWLGDSIRVARSMDCRLHQMLEAAKRGGQ